MKDSILSKYYIADILEIYLLDENGSKNIWYSKEKDGPYKSVEELLKEEEE